MKKSFCLIFILIATLFSGCVFASAREELKNEKRYMQSRSDEIIRCFDEKDADGLKSMFCLNDQSNPYLKEEIENAFSRYEGTSVSYEHFDVGTSGGTDYGVCVDKHFSAEIRDIVTTADSTYEIVYGEYMIYKADEKEIGIVFITLVDSNGEIVAKIGWDD